MLKWCIKTKKIQFILLFSRQGKLRLQKWYLAYPEKTKKKIIRELVANILSRKQKTSSFLEWKESKIVYKRYASLYFCCCIDQEDNELLTLEIIHRYVELLDKYFGSVCVQSYNTSNIYKPYTVYKYQLKLDLPKKENIRTNYYNVWIKSKIEFKPL